MSRDPRELAEAAWRRTRSQLGRARRRVKEVSAKRLVPKGDIRRLPPDDFVRAAYEMVLGREPEASGLAHWTGRLRAGELTPDQVVDNLLASAEFAALGRPRDFVGALHRSRVAWVRSLPPARRILDLGGASQGNPAGALVDIGWPYEFDQLIIVDLPSEDRHELFAAGPRPTHVDSPLGPVEYRYHSMANLDDYADASFDMVFSGQSIEHVTEADADTLIAGALRVLVPGGWFCLDTPNGAVCRLHTGEALIHPDHKIEYTHEQLSRKLLDAGFDVVEAKGLILMSESVAKREFSTDELLRNVGTFSQPSECYLLAYVCRKRDTDVATGNLR